MRKHDLIVFGLMLAAIAGGVLFYSGYALAAQLVFFPTVIFSILMTKLVGAPLQGWWALIVCIGFGFILGDWWLSPALALGYLSINLRSFIFKKDLYTTALATDMSLVFTGIIIYVITNIYHHNGWQCWAFPGVVLLMGVLISIDGYRDRSNVKKMLAMGVIAPGTPAPEFSLTDQNGNTISTADYKGKRDLLLIFVRGDWCPGCHIMLRLYERERKKFQDKNVMLLAIGPDPIGVNLAMVKKLGVEFAVLSDEDMSVSKKFCVRVQEKLMGKELDHGIPLPASFLVDKKGIVRYTSRADNAGEFLSPDIIFDVLAKI